MNHIFRLVLTRLYSFSCCVKQNKWSPYRSEWPIKSGLNSNVYRNRPQWVDELPNFKIRRRENSKREVFKRIFSGIFCTRILYTVERHQHSSECDVRRQRPTIQWMHAHQLQKLVARMTLKEEMKENKKGRKRLTVLLVRHANIVRFVALMHCRPWRPR